MVDTTAVRNYLLELQKNICDELGALEPGTSFRGDDWVRDEGGGGQSRVIEGGEVSSLP